LAKKKYLPMVFDIYHSIRVNNESLFNSVYWIDLYMGGCRTRLVA
jgi:hypothetical protein